MAPVSAPGHPAQLRRGPGQRLLRLALAGALEDPGHLGQQVGPAPGQRSDFGQRGRFLVLGERAPLGAMARLAGQLSHQDPVGISAGTILVHLVRIEPDYVKSNLISENNIGSFGTFDLAQARASR